MDCITISSCRHDHMECYGDYSVCDLLKWFICRVLMLSFFMLILTIANIPLLVLVVGKFVREEKRVMVSLKSFDDVASLFFTFSTLKPEFRTQFYLFYHLEGL